MAKNKINDFMDFDAAFAEMNHETVSFKVFGKTYKIKKEIPAYIVTQMMRLEDDDTLPTRVIFKAADLIYGKKVIDELCEHDGFSAEQLNMMVKWAFEAVHGKKNEKPKEQTEDDDDEVERKN